MAQTLASEREKITQESSDLGDRVRRLRALKGWTQEELARRVGVSRNQVWMIESGVSKTLQRRVRQSYAREFGVTEHYLLHGTEPDPSQELPPIGSYLRAVYDFTDEQIGLVSRVVGAMEAEQELALMASLYSELRLELEQRQGHLEAEYAARQALDDERLREWRHRMAERPASYDQDLKPPPEWPPPEGSGE